MWITLWISRETLQVITFQNFTKNCCEGLTYVFGWTIIYMTTKSCNFMKGTGKNNMNEQKEFFSFNKKAKLILNSTDRELFIDDHTSYVLSLIPFRLNPHYDQDRKKWGEIWDKEHKEDK